MSKVDSRFLKIVARQLTDDAYNTNSHKQDLLIEQYVMYMYVTCSNQYHHSLLQCHLIPGSSMLRVFHQRYSKAKH